jgi:hypothetical protein
MHWKLLGPALCLGVVVGALVLVLRFAAREDHMDQKEAQQKFLSIVEDNRRGDYGTMEQAFRNAFKVNDLASDYEHILKTTKPQPFKTSNAWPVEFSDADTVYTWILDDGKDMAGFYVFVGDSPPRILHISWAQFGK